MNSRSNKRLRENPKASLRCWPARSTTTRSFPIPRPISPSPNAGLMQSVSKPATRRFENSGSRAATTWCLRPKCRRQMRKRTSRKFSTTPKAWKSRRQSRVRFGFSITPILAPREMSIRKRKSLISASRSWCSRTRFASTSSAANLNRGKSVCWHASVAASWVSHARCRCSIRLPNRSSKVADLASTRPTISARSLREKMSNRPWRSPRTRSRSAARPHLRTW